MKEPVWLLPQVVLACHAESLLAHGGSEGVREAGLLESALARPRHLFHYEKADIPRLAAVYAHGIAKNHPFVDGNKRTAFLAAAVFLERNGFALAADPGAAAVFTIALADGSIDEAGFAIWLREHVRVARRPSASRGKRKPTPKHKHKQKPKRT
jgi:death-on-curing protein